MAVSGSMHVTELPGQGPVTLAQLVLEGLVHENLLSALP